jgi:hypothetical protein
MSNKKNFADDRRSVMQSHPIHADRIGIGAGLAGAETIPSTSSFNRIPMLISPWRAAWA